MKAGNSRILRAILLILITIILCPFAYGKTIYVDDDAAGTNDGSSWENAYVYLQEALADADAAEKPVEIRVAQGIYKPNGGLVAIPEFDWRTTTFQLINGVALKGGYAGINEADPNVRDVSLYETILSGDLNCDDIGWNELLDIRDLQYPWLTEPNREDNSYHVVSSIGLNETAILDGVTISNGNAFGLYPYWNGGGIYNDSSSPTVKDCILKRNSSRIHGGGMYCDNNSNPILTDCIFTMNWALDGGGIYNENNSNPILTNCIFTYHFTAITEVIVERGYLGCGGIHNSRSSPKLSNCTFSENLESGMHNLVDSNPTLTNCTFTGNTGYFGGGIYNDASSPILINCIFSGNSALRIGGGMSNYESSPVLTNCTFSGNKAEAGGGIYGDDPILINCILWGNAPDQIGDNAIVLYSDIQGGWEGEGNIDADPLFVEPGYWDSNGTPDDPNDDFWVEGDYHLKSQAGRWNPNSESWVVDDVTSPCIDAGDPNSPVGDEPEPNGGRINMGAYGGTAEASKSGDLWWFETTQGAIAAEGLGVILPHEHIFTDLRGPATRGYGQADAADVVCVMAPYLEEAKQKGVGMLFECSSIGVGRNVSILSQVSAASGLPVVVPTGVYGRANFAPVEHKNMSEDELTELFISEIREGIEGTGIKAGFIKIATGGGNMNTLEEKILRAAGRAAHETRAAIASHTTVGSNATRQADILESISPEIRFIWVHAQSANNLNLYKQLAERGVFIEFDSLGWNPGQDSTFIAAIKDLLASGYGEKILLSHDAGWYQPGEQNGGTQMPYTYLIETFIPKLRNSGIDDEAIRMITEINPIRAFGFNQDVRP